jgi:hypothetical protein
MIRIALIFVAVFAVVFAVTFLDFSGSGSGEVSAPAAPAPRPVAPAPEPGTPAVPLGPAVEIPERREVPVVRPVVPPDRGPALPDRELRDLEALEARARSIEERIEALVGRLQEEDADEAALAAELEGLLEQYDALMDP